MRKAFWVTLIFTALATAVLLAVGRPAWGLGLWVGSVWGLANAWCLIRTARCAVSGRRSWRLAGWIGLKFIGLYGLLAWALIGWKISPVGWLMGFTMSLIGLAMAQFPSLYTNSHRPSSGPAAALIFGISGAAAMFGWMGAAFASEAAASGSAPAHPPEIPNFITLITHWAGHGPVVEFLHTWENGIFAFLIVFIVGGGIAFGARSLALLPSRGQVAVEAVVEGLDELVCGVLGKEEGRRYLPFLGTLFLFILSMNLAGLVPGFKSPTSRFEMTGALALCVFAFVQWTGIRRLGLIGYMDHMIGQPRDPVGWILSPLMLFIHGIGEIVKPISLALRLFGNIMGEDTLLGVFVVLGALCMAWSRLPIGIPLHLPFVLLAIIFSIVQALVFTSLSMIYIYMMLPHHEAQEAREGH